MNFIKRINLLGWLMLVIALLLGLRYLIPGLNAVMHNPSRELETLAVFVAAFCFGYFGIKAKKS